MKNNGIIDARTLACYIKEYYKTNFKKEDISPLKLQKALYFCFAYWGGFARLMKTNKNEVEKEYNEILFPNTIEAWVYGPVVPDVYNETNLEKYKRNNPFKDDFVKEYINGILNDVLAANDFKLVEVSHQDKRRDNFRICKIIKSYGINIFLLLECLNK